MNMIAIITIILAFVGLAVCLYIGTRPTYYLIEQLESLLDSNQKETQ